MRFYRSIRMDKKPWRRDDRGREDEIRIIAYGIWEEEGCCDGHDCEHWLKAEVIWQQKQKNEATSIDTKAKLKQTTRQGKKDRAEEKVDSLMQKQGRSLQNLPRSYRRIRTSSQTGRK